MPVPEMGGGIRTNTSLAHWIEHEASTLVEGQQNMLDHFES